MSFLRSNPLISVAVVSAVLIFARLIFALVKAKRAVEVPSNVILIGLSLITIVSLGMPMFVGGDHFGGFRLLQPLWPIYGVVLTVVFARYCGYFNERIDTRWLRLDWAASIFLFFCVSNYSNWYMAKRSGIPIEFEVARDSRSLGVTLNKMFTDSPPFIGVIPAGGIRVTYNGKILDLVGLNSVAMAHRSNNREGYLGHAAFDKTVFFDELPDPVVPEKCDTKPENGRFAHLQFENEGNKAHEKIRMACQERANNQQPRLPPTFRWLVSVAIHRFRFDAFGQRRARDHT